MKKTGRFSGGFAGRVLRRVSAQAVFFSKAAVFTVLLTGCEWFVGPELPAPEDLTATTGKADKIELAWSAVEKADIYYIYRADTADGEYDYHAFSYSAAYTDTKIAYERPYFYKVAAGDMETNNESPKSAAAEGNSTHEYSWSTAVIVPTGAAQQRLAMDTTDPADDSEAGVVYMAAAADDGTGAVTVYKYNREEGSWTALGEPFGTTDTADTAKHRLLDICAAGGEVYAAYSDKGLGGKVTVRNYNETNEVWEVFPSAADEGFSSGTNARYLSMDVDSADTVFVAYIDSSGAFINTSSDNFESNLAPTDFSADDSSVILDLLSSAPYAAYEDEGTDIEAAGKVVGTGGQNLRDNYLDFVAVSGSEMYIAYFTDALYVKKYNGSDWSTDLTPAGITASLDPDSVALEYDNPTGSGEGTLFLFYSEHDSIPKGIVMKFTGSPPAWQTVAVDAETDEITSNPNALELAAYNNFIYASYLVGSAAQMRVWE